MPLMNPFLFNNKLYCKLAIEETSDIFKILCIEISFCLLL